MSDSKRSILGIVFFTVFLDIVGFSIIFPLFPDMLDYYLNLEGQNSFIGRIVSHLEQFAGSDSNAVVTLFGGLLGSIYGVLQFVFATVWGALSDRIGRKPTLQITLIGTAIAHVLWAFSGVFATLILARMLGGIMAGNISTASACIADTTSAKDRAMGMGIVGMAIGLGFILGPAIGAGLAMIPLDYGHSSAYLALNPFTGAAVGSLILSIINLAWVHLKLPETFPPEKRNQGAQLRSLNPITRLKTIQLPGVSRTNALYFIYLCGFTAVEFTLSFLAVERFDYTHMDLAIMFVFIGLIIAAVQGGVVRKLVPKIGEQKVVQTGFAFTIPAYALCAFAQTESVFYGGLALMAIGTSLISPALSALISRYVPEDRQGLALGAFRSMGSLSRAIGPIIGAIAYYKYGSHSPFLFAIIMVITPMAMAFALPSPPEVNKKANA